MKDKIVTFVLLTIFIGLTTWISKSFEYGNVYLASTVLVTALLCVIISASKGVENVLE